MEPESSLPYSQMPATCPYPEPPPSSLHPPHSYLYKIRIGTAGFLFGFLTKEVAADRLSRNVSKLPLLAA